jgi:hypothetical protein
MNDEPSTEPKSDPVSANKVDRDEVGLPRMGETLGATAYGVGAGTIGVPWPAGRESCITTSGFVPT